MPSACRLRRDGVFGLSSPLRLGCLGLLRLRHRCLPTLDGGRVPRHMTDERLTRRIDHQRLVHPLRKTRGRELRKGPRKRCLARNGPEAGPAAQSPQCRVHPEPVDQMPRRRKVPHGPGRKCPRKSAAVFRRAIPAASRCAHEALDADEIRRRHETAMRPRQRTHLLRQRREQLPLKPMPETGWLRAQGHRGCLPGRLWAQTRDTTERPRNPTLPLPQNQPKSRLFGRFCKRLDHECRRAMPRSRLIRSVPLLFSRKTVASISIPELSCQGGPPVPVGAEPRRRGSQPMLCYRRWRWTHLQ